MLLQACLHVCLALLPTHVYSSDTWAPPMTTQEAGIDPTSPRDSWPLAKLVRVLEGMQQSGECSRGGEGSR